MQFYCSLNSQHDFFLTLLAKYHFKLTQEPPVTVLLARTNAAAAICDGRYFRKGSESTRLSSPRYWKSFRFASRFAHGNEDPGLLKTHHCQVFHPFANRLVKEVLCEKLVNGWCGQIKGEHFKHQMLHSQHLLLRVSVICDVNKLCHLWRVDLLKFPAIQHAVFRQDCTEQA